MPIPADISEVVTGYNRSAATSTAQYKTLTTGPHTLASVAPTTQVGATTGTFLITATGTGFVSGTHKILYDGSPVATNYVSATSLTATVPKKPTGGSAGISVIDANGMGSDVRVTSFT